VEVKDGNLQSEITVEVLCDKETLFKLLNNKGYFFKERLHITDFYYTRLDLSKCIEFKDLSRNSFLVRDVKLERKYFSNDGVATLLYKHKAFDKNNNVISEQKLSCNIDVDASRRIFDAAGLSNWCVKKMTGYVFKKEGKNGQEAKEEILVQEVHGLGIFIEIEQFDESAGTRDEVLDGLVDLINELGVPCGNDFHINIAYRLYLQRTNRVPVKFFPGLSIK